MVDGAALRDLVAAAAIGPSDVVLEPGAGPGNLTALLAACAGCVVAVETDVKLYALACERLTQSPNVRIIHADIMAGKDAVDAEAMAAVREGLAAAPGARFKVVANLPYCVGTAVVTALTACAPVPDVLAVTVQKEVAGRICAGPGTKEYGFLSVMVQAVAKVECLRTLGPRAFWPQPEVESAIIRISPDAALRRKAGDLGRLRRLASGLFTHRRKQIGRVMVMAGFAADREAAEALLSRAGVAPTARPEAVSVAKMLALARHVHSL